MKGEPISSRDIAIRYRHLNRRFQVKFSLSELEEFAKDNKLLKEDSLFIINGKFKGDDLFLSDLQIVKVDWKIHSKDEERLKKRMQERMRV